MNELTEKEQQETEDTRGWRILSEFEKELVIILNVNSQMSEEYRLSMIFLGRLKKLRKEVK